MYSKKLYWICTIVLFLGLLWMFLPHATHSVITGKAEEETEHYVHLIEGAIPTIISLILMIWNEKKGKISSKKR
jgi:hypothetical protein